MTAFVLVHGAWHGGWCWDAVADILRRSGARVAAPTLAGQGDLDRHIGEIADSVLAQGEPVVLVGHSYGGMVIEGVCDRQPGRVAQAVFLDALTPANGESALPGVTRAGVEARFGPIVHGGVAPPADLARFGIVDPVLAEQVRARLRPHPVTAFVQPLSLTGKGSRGLPRTFVLCSDKADPPPAWVQALRTDPSWTFRELKAGHDAMITHPAETARLLLELAAPA